MINHQYTRPEYIFKPKLLFNRIFGLTRGNIIKLPWGYEISINSDINNKLYKSLYLYGIYDLALTEMLYRLIRPGDVLVDVGANVGYMTSIMSTRVKNTGKIFCFEPNKQLFNELNFHINHWNKIVGIDNITLVQSALSDTLTKKILFVPLYNQGEGTVSLEENRKDLNNSHEIYEINCDTMDNYFKDNLYVNLLKIDVEGHELEVLKGARNLLNRRMIQNIVYEDHNLYPNKVSEYLEKMGYKIFKIWKGLLRPKLISPDKNLIHSWEPPNFIASLDQNNLENITKKLGWKSLY